MGLLSIDLTDPDNPNGPQLSLQDWVERNHDSDSVFSSNAGQAGLFGEAGNGSYGSTNADNRVYSTGAAFREAYGITGFDPETGSLITDPDLNYNGPSVPDDETSLRQRLQNFGSDESGYLDLERAAEFANQMVDNLRDFANEHPDFMRAVGIIGGIGAVLSEVGEFIGDANNRETLRESFETGDFSEFFSEFGGAALEGVAYGAAAIAGIATVAAIPVIGPPLATGIAAGMVAYGTYEAAIGLWELANDEDLINAAVDYYNTHTIGEMAFDLDGDGVELVSLADSTAYFDLNLDGFAELTGWVSPDDALLALDVDGDGIIDDNSELFSDQTGQANGFLALAQHDSNNDGVIDANDAVFADLIVWRDLDGDGFSDAGEMMSLSDKRHDGLEVAGLYTAQEIPKRRGRQRQERNALAQNVSRELRMNAASRKVYCEQTMIPGIPHTNPERRVTPTGPRKFPSTQSIVPQTGLRADQSVESGSQRRRIELGH